MRGLTLVFLGSLGIAACGSSGSSSGAGGSDGGGSGGSAATGGSKGGSGGTPASGGSGGSCVPECDQANFCVTSCGETPVDYGCCSCPAGMLNTASCPDAGSGGTGGICHPSGSTTSFSCGSNTCSQGQICVHPCCGGISFDGGGCTPPPPFCGSATDVDCTSCDSTTNCKYLPDSSCSGGFLQGSDLNCMCA